MLYLPPLVHNSLSQLRWTSSMGAYSWQALPHAELLMETLTHKGGHAADQGTRHVNFSFRFGMGSFQMPDKWLPKSLRVLAKVQENLRKHKENNSTNQNM